MTNFDWTIYSPALPEIVLAVSILALLVIGAFCKEKDAPHVVSRLTFLSLLGTLAALIFTWDGLTQFAFPRLGEGIVTDAGSAMFVLDGFAFFAKGLILLATILCLHITKDYLERQKILKFEYYILASLCALGAMIMVSAHDLLMLYMGLEMMSFSLYIMAAYNRDNAKSSEAGLKYFVLGSLASAILLYGMSLLYGISGTTSFIGVQEALGVLARNESIDPASMLTMSMALVLMITGLAFKISAVPFHMWTPDVYEGSPRSVTAFMAVVPKIAAICVFLRVLHEPLFYLAIQWQQILLIIAVATMVVGALMAVIQDNLKRLIAYSSIVHVGFMLVPMVTGTEAGISAILFYLVIYAIMSIGIFGVFSSVRNRDAFAQTVDDLSGLSKKNPLLAFAMMLFMFSLAGIPPLAGFSAKFIAFKVAVENGLVWLAIVAVIFSVVAAYYCIRVVKVMYFSDDSKNWSPELPMSLKVVVGLMLVATIGFGLFPDVLTQAADYAASSLYTGGIARG